MMCCPSVVLLSATAGIASIICTYIIIVLCTCVAMWVSVCVLRVSIMYGRRKMSLLLFFFIAMTYDRSHHLLNIKQSFGLFFCCCFFGWRAGKRLLWGDSAQQSPVVEANQIGKRTDRWTHMPSIHPASKETWVQSNKKYFYCFCCCCCWCCCCRWCCRHYYFHS